MAVNGPQIVTPFISELDGTAGTTGTQYRACQIGSGDFKVLIASQNTVARAIGILQNEATSGHNVRVCVFGQTKAVYGGTVTRGLALTHDSSGALIGAASGQFIIGTALESGVVGDIGSILFGATGNLGGNL